MLSFLSVILIYSAPLNQLAQGPTTPSTPGQTQGQAPSAGGQAQSKKQQQVQEPLFLEGGETTQVTAFDFAGNSEVPTAELEQLVAPYLNQPIAQSDLGVIKGRIQSYYQAKGFPEPQVMISLAQGSSTLSITITESQKTN